MIDFLQTRWSDVLYRSYQHASLVVQAEVIAFVLALLVGVLVLRVAALRPVVNALTSVGLTLPSFALLGIALPVLGIGVMPSIAVVVFYATLPVLRSVIVGLDGVPPTLVESARGMGMSTLDTLLRVRLPLAWPVILTGLRVSTQMSAGVAAIAAYALGPGLGGYIFSGLSQIGGANALNYALVGTLGVVVVALLLDAGLVLIGRLTIPRGVRA